MNREELTPDERDALSVEELVEHDMRHVKRDPHLSEDALRRLIRARVRHERTETADRRLAAEAGTTYEALRQAREEQAANELRSRSARHVAVARALLGVSDARRDGGPPSGIDPDGVTVDRIVREYRALGSPTQAAVAERIGCTDRRVRQVLHAANPPLIWRDVDRLAHRK